MSETIAREEFIKRSGRMRALNYLAKLHPEEFVELKEEGKQEAARLYDALDCLFPNEGNKLEKVE